MLLRLLRGVETQIELVALCPDKRVVTETLDDLVQIGQARVAVGRPLHQLLH